MGNAGNITAYWLGFQAIPQAERPGLPRLYGVQAAGAAPLVDGAPVDRPETVATAIRIGSPARGEQALAAMRESGGGVGAVTDAEILRHTGCSRPRRACSASPPRPASVAGLMARAEAGDLAEGETVVCVLTGHGLKDPDTAIVNSEAVRRLPADLGAVEEAVLG